MTTKAPISVARAAWIKANFHFRLLTYKMHVLCDKADVTKAELEDCFKAYKEVHNALVDMQQGLERDYPAKAVCYRNGRLGQPRSLWDRELLLEEIEVHD